MPYVQRNEQGGIICHYANRQDGFAEEWIDDGSPAADFAQQVPQIVSRFKARAALLSTPSLHEGFSNMLEEVDAFMNSDQVDSLARLAWTDAQEFNRTSPNILAISPLLDLSDDDLDQLFIAAAGIDA